jgi:BirA family biotin operon repressor/biotin-[acetyl-CoA-carboxylase] ligase
MNSFATVAPLDWRSEDLWLALEPLRPGLTVEVRASADSTNTRLLERCRQGDCAPGLLVAERQEAGRGRLGRSWWSDAPGGSLTFSLGLPFAPPDWSGLSLAVGLALAEALDPEPAAGWPQGRLALKWPNDLWLRDGQRKLGGILLETAPLPQDGVFDPKARWLVIGVGLNVRPRALAPEDAAQFASGFAATDELLPGLDAPAVLHRVAVPLLRTLSRFEQQGWAPFATAFEGRNLLRGREISLGAGESATCGRVVGLDETGALLVHTAAGIRAVHSGEVSVRPC